MPSIVTFPPETARALHEGATRFRTEAADLRARFDSEPALTPATELRHAAHEREVWAEQIENLLRAHGGMPWPDDLMLPIEKDWLLANGFEPIEAQYGDGWLVFWFGHLRDLLSGPTRRESMGLMIGASAKGYGACFLATTREDDEVSLIFLHYASSRAGVIKLAEGLSGRFWPIVQPTTGGANV